MSKMSPIKILNDCFDYVGDRFGDLANSFEIGDYFLTNAALFSQRDNWRLGLNFNNLF